MIKEMIKEKIEHIDSLVENLGYKDWVYNHITDNEFEIKLFKKKYTLDIEADKIYHLTSKELTESSLFEAIIEKLTFLSQKSNSILMNWNQIDKVQKILLRAGVIIMIESVRDGEEISYRAEFQDPERIRVNGEHFWVEDVTPSLALIKFIKKIAGETISIIDETVINL